MPPKPTTTVKRNKGATFAQASAAIEQDWDTEDEYMGDEAMVDPLQGIVNQMDSMMDMILELANKVNCQRVPEEEMGSSTTSPPIEVSTREKES